MTQYGAGRIFAVVLTAGAGSRLGGLCKGLLRVQGKTLLARQVAALAQVPVQGCVAVLGHQAQSVRDEITQIRLADLEGFSLEEFRLESTEVQTRAISRSGREDIQISVRQGLLAVSEMLDETDLGILVTLVDCPLINSDSIRHLLETETAPISSFRNAMGRMTHADNPSQGTRFFSVAAWSWALILPIQNSRYVVF
jgi:CTP:molybdopterin cytidylyltransferase MocA